ncbi:50S ribosomal protein L32 [Candidatus Dojkabacteria bacterium]|uniref:Large ribosomal subunit protein bL32 n=1 Tax=Candidatus Dojkabacteria bacterium TaxID=2099670 RepID=A0A955KVV0_9BACT|nr:50S ribosomal protein L32 [Candidatus Dojkabacteria bacterium]MCB9790693.1 50S ribosomal protein L32 [Candidatus Nomurabacteria bacterium]
MGAQPKRKISKGRRNRRRAQDALDTPPMSKCPKCGKVKRPHFECAFCGHYGEVKNSAKAAAGKSDSDSQKKINAK